MAKRWTVVFGIAIFAVAAAAQDTSQFKTPQEKISYALGMEIGNNFRKQALDVDPASVGRCLQADQRSGGRLWADHAEDINQGAGQR